MNNLYSKKKNLEDILKNMGSVAVAFSSGVDSTFLLKTAHDILGENVIAVTAKSCSFPKRELDESIRFCKEEGILHIQCDSEELSIKGFSDNPPNRCYLCKRELFGKIKNIAKKQNIKYVAEGSNADDCDDYRPGFKAVKELGIRSPLLEAGLTKSEIRNLSKEMNLKTWDKPSFACLASRFVYGEKITEEKLSMVEKAEQYLLNSGFKQVRVRMHRSLARIEVDKHEFEKIFSSYNEISKKFHDIGFLYVTLDLDGYITGSMNKTLNKAKGKE